MTAFGHSDKPSLFTLAVIISLLQERRRRKDDYQKNCVKLRARTKAYRLKNLDKAKASCRKWKERNPDHNKRPDEPPQLVVPTFEPPKKQGRGGRHKNPDTLSIPEQHKRWHAANPNYRRDYNRTYRAECRARKPLNSGELTLFFARCLLQSAITAEQQRRSRNKWDEKNREKKNAHNLARYYARKQDSAAREKDNKSARAYDKKRRETNQNFRLRKALRERVRVALEGTVKVAKTTELLGCSIDFLWAHLEKKFQVGKVIDGKFYPDMTRENRGTVWHVDHIRPCSSFDLADPSQQKICFHYSNLQPLFAPENLSKGDKWLSEV